VRRDGIEHDPRRFTRHRGKIQPIFTSKSVSL
jgi:hypothetical protein